MQSDANREDAEPLLDEELAALPERYRLPIVLCDLEGRLRSEVARSLGCSEGTLSSRLTRGRRLLAERLRCRGVHLCAGALALVATQRAAALPEPLIRATVPAALSSASAPAGAGCAVSPAVAQLAKGVMKSMFLKKLQTIAVAAFVAAVAALAVTGVVTDRSQAAPVPKTPAPPAADDKEVTAALADVDGQLLMNRKVLKDIKCDMDQFDKIMDVLEAAQQKANEKTNEAMMQIKLNANPNVNPAAIDQMFKDAQEAGDKEFRKAVGQVVGTVLTPAQRKRLREIDLQVRGAEAFTTPAVSKALELTPQQKEKFAENVKQIGEDMNAAFQKPPVAGPNGVVAFDFNKVVSDARAEALKRAVALLTDEQKAVWKKLTGESFTHPINNFQWKRGGFGFGFGGVGAGVAPAKVFPAGPANGVAPGNVVPAVPPPAPVDPGK